MLPFVRVPLIPRFDNATVKQQKERAEQIASNIKLIRLTTITNSWQMLNTTIESDEEVVASRLPENASAWCIRVVLDRMKMFLNRISDKEVKTALESRFDVYVDVLSDY